MRDVLTLDDKFVMIDDKRYPIEIDSAETREVIRLPYYHWEHTGTIGWYNREFSILLNYKDKSVTIQETTDNDLVPITDPVLLQKLVTFASEKGLLEYKQPEITLGAFRF